MFLFHFRYFPGDLISAVTFNNGLQESLVGADSTSCANHGAGGSLGGGNHNQLKINSSQQGLHPLDIHHGHPSNCAAAVTTATAAGMYCITAANPNVISFKNNAT